MLKKREEKLFERLVIGMGSQLISYANQRLKGLKFADCLVYRKVTFRGRPKGQDRINRFAKKRKLATNSVVGESAVVDSCVLCGVCGDIELAKEFCVNGMIKRQVSGLKHMNQSIIHHPLEGLTQAARERNRSIVGLEGSEGSFPGFGIGTTTPPFQLGGCPLWSKC
ncbi:hypothetical protein PoB_005849200 [Plakobranchus ocellatus]|uniref:Uncharacterized protein n=1 Tax=Plakobranchus ocellatus TaxID=259542 RepID=A0AAV4CKB5_9GAST|nr:hypothetical protein PoB_005849200 [Plakobranchus ocellatus]